MHCDLGEGVAEGVEGHKTGFRNVLGGKAPSCWQGSRGDFSRYTH